MRLSSISLTVMILIAGSPLLAASVTQPTGFMISFDEQEFMKPLFISAPKKGASVVEVNLSDVRQEISGFGGTLTQASVKNINRLQPKIRRYILEKMFSKSNGYGLDSLRIPLGATDFSDPLDGNHTYDDTPDNVPDIELASFSMEKDAATFELLHEIVAINPDLRIMLSPWTAPAWMKDSKSLQGGWLVHQYFEAYGRYLLRIVAEYKKMGFKIDSLTMVNEPGVYWAPFTCMGMSSEDQGRVLAETLGPGLRAIAPEVKILALDHNWGMASWIEDEIKAVPEAKQYIDGIAFHCYGGTVADMAAASKKYNLPVYQTECSPYESKMSERRWYMGWWIDNQIIEGGRNGAASGMGWNIALDEYYGPNQSFCKNCRGLISVFGENGTLSNEYPELRALGLASKYTGPGTRVIGSSSKDETIGNIAYLNKDGSKIVVLRNRSDVKKSIQVKDSKGKGFSLELPAEGAVSIKY
jgi:glucosylceramidase